MNTYKSFSGKVVYLFFLTTLAFSFFSSCTPPLTPCTIPDTDNTNPNVGITLLLGDQKTEIIDGEDVVVSGEKGKEYNVIASGEDAGCLKHLQVFVQGGEFKNTTGTNINHDETNSTEKLIATGTLRPMIPGQAIRIWAVADDYHGNKTQSGSMILTSPDPVVYDIYIGNYPKARETEWAENVQGVTHDNANWYITQTSTLWRIPLEGIDLNNAKRGDPGVSTIELDDINDLRDKGYNHFGDLDYFASDGQGYLLVPIEGGPSAIAAFDATTLRYLGYALVPLENVRAPWCAVDPQGYVYMSNTDIMEPYLVYKFEVDWTVLSSGEGGWLSLVDHLSWLDETGEYAVWIDTPQGGAISEDGRFLYIVAGYYNEEYLDPDSWGVHVLDLQTGYEIERSKNGSGPFNYEFHPGLEAQEAEGMTIWDLDDANVPGITGKLHILMLENDVRSSDDVYFKHYTDKFAYPVLYTDSDYGGGPLPLRANLPNLETKGFNDVISSVWVPSGWVIEVFEHAYFEGASTQFRISDSSIHNEGWGDRISSVKIFPPDAKQPTAIPNAPAPVCDGTIVDGYCWYLGREGLSCNDVCASHGGYDSATRTYAGSSGSSVKCWRVITSLNITLDDFYETAQSGRGCFVIRSSSGNYLGYWDELPTTADVPGGQRICACRR